MVVRKDLNKKFALISVYDKKHLRYLCLNLIRNDYYLISTGSTGNKIRSMGFNCTDVSKITKFKEMFDGRVKTLNPLIYSSLLYVRDNKLHLKEFKSLKMPEIDLDPLSITIYNEYFLVTNYKDSKIYSFNDIEKTTKQKIDSLWRWKKYKRMDLC